MLRLQTQVMVRKEITMSMSQQVVYAGSYATADQPGIYTFAFDDTIGELIAHGSFVGIPNPSFLVVHPNGQWLYAVSEVKQDQDGIPGAVWAFCRTDESWSLEPLNQQSSGGDWPCHLTINATGEWLLVSNYASGTVSVLPILADGALGEITDRIQHHGRGPNAERQEGPHAHSAIFTPDQRFAIVADLGMDALLLYKFDAAAGRLYEHRHTSTRPGAGPRHMAFHPNGKHLFVANELDNTVAMYNYDAASGELHEQQSVKTLPPDVLENTVADIHVSPVGNHVYVSNRGHDSVTSFKIEADGRLTCIAHHSSMGRGPRNFAFAPAGQFLLVANQQSSELIVLPIQNDSGELASPVARVAIKSVSCVCFATIKEVMEQHEGRKR